MSETILANDLTQFGLRRVHVIGEARMDAKRWVEDLGVPYEAEGSLEVRQYKEEGVGFWHLWIIWHVRGEVVRMSLRGRGGMSGNWVGVWWYVEPGERLGEVVEAAALRYLALFGYWPSMCWTQVDAPVGAPVEVRLDDEAVMKMHYGCEWAPRRCVVVGMTPPLAQPSPQPSPSGRGSSRSKLQGGEEALTPDTLTQPLPKKRVHVPKGRGENERGRGGRPQEDKRMVCDGA